VRAFQAVLVGGGEVEVEAFGLADAEATLEKELRTALPGAVIGIREIRRAEPEEHRIVETFSGRYALRLPLEILAPDGESARRQAFAAGRRALAGTRFERAVWERVDLHQLP
jgi:hypothetical protein